MRFYFDTERIIHGFKTALACFVGFTITKSVHFQFDQWLIITVLVVMCAQINVGSVIHKSYMRFLGTLAGSGIAACVLKLFGTNPIAISATIGVCAMIFSYIATGQKSYSESGTLGAVTVVIILVGQSPTVFSAFERFVEISVGILVAALISQFVLPIHARAHLRKTQAMAIRQLRAFYLATLLTDHEEETTESYQELDETIAKSLISQRKLANEAVKEPLGAAFDIKRFRQLLACEKELLRSISFMHHAYRMSPESKKTFSSMNLLHDFHDGICQALSKIADSIDNNTSKQLAITLPTTQPIKDSISSEMKNFDANDSVYADAYLFCTEILLVQLQKMIALVKKMGT
jgi:uncharacterized membrane protein YccC